MIYIKRDLNFLFSGVVTQLRLNSLLLYILSIRSFTTVGNTECCNQDSWDVGA